MQIAEQAVHKVKLKSGKIVMIREPLISDTEHATSIAGKGNSDNQALLGFTIQKEMLKLLIVSIGKEDENGQFQGKKPSIQELQMLNQMFTVKEFGQLVGVVRKLSEPDEEGNEPTEIGFGDSSSK